MSSHKTAWPLAAALVGLFLAGQSLGHSAPPGSPASDAEALIREGHWKRARAILEPDVQAHPQDARKYYLLAQVKMAFQDFEGALPLAQHAVDLDAKNSDFHFMLGKIYGDLAARASMFSAGALAIKFRKELETAIQLNPKNLDALDAMMQFKFQAPILMGGDKNEAHRLVGQMISLDPSEGYLAQSELAALEKNPSEMELSLLKAVQVNPQSYSARVELAKYYTQSSHAKFEEAANNARYARQVDPDQIVAHWILARVAALQQQWAEAEQYLSVSEKDVPDDLRPFYEAAEASLETGKELSRAEDFARKYLSQEPEGEEPDLAEGHRLLGLLLAKEGRNSEARGQIQMALQLRPDFRAAKDDLKRMGD